MPPKTFDEVMRDQAHDAMIRKQMEDHQRENPLKAGFQRIYEDHTYRNYKDYSDAELEEASRDPVMMDFHAILQEEINLEIVQKLKREAEHQRIVEAVRQMGEKKPE